MFDAAALLDLAKARYGEDILRNRMRGADGDGTFADAELLAIAESVISRVQSAAVAQVGWPFPSPYDETWPADLLQNALVLFNWRTLAGNEGSSENQTTAGKAAEAYFQKVQNGALSIGIGGDRDTQTPELVSARSRSGANLTTDAGTCDRENVLDTFRGRGWDYVS